MNKLNNDNGMDFHGIKYKNGRFNYLFMFIGGAWVKSTFNVSELIVEAKRQKNSYQVSEFTDCYNAKIKRESEK